MAISKMKYAAVVRWSRIEIASTETELQRLQTATCIMINGAVRATPTKVMEMLLDSPILSTVVEAAA